VGKLPDPLQIIVADIRNPSCRSCTRAGLGDSCVGQYSWSMTDEQRFEQFIELCKRIFERMEREGSWPWSEDEKEKPPESGDITNE
jgi:hypothetical protein